MTDPRDDLIDAELRAAFRPPDEAAFARAARAAVVRPQPLARWPWVVALAAAAAVLLVFVLRADPRGPEGHDGRELGALWASAYQQAVASGFGGSGCCDPGVDFSADCERRFAARLELPAEPGVQVVGCYCGGPTGGCLAVLLRSGGERVVVFVLPKGHDPAPRLPADEGLHLERREVGPLAIYALAPSPARRLLDAFRLPSAGS
jgi:hypothetical protein